MLQFSHFPALEPLGQPQREKELLTLPFAPLERLAPTLELPCLPEQPASSDSVLGAFLRGQVAADKLDRASRALVEEQHRAGPSTPPRFAPSLPADTPSRSPSPCSSTYYEQRPIEPATQGVLTWDAFCDLRTNGSRPPPSPSPYLTDARVEAEAGDPSDVDLFEAVMHAIEPLPPNARFAPAYEASSVLASLLDTASLGTSSAHFQWDTKHERFSWSGHLFRQAQAKEARMDRRSSAAAAPTEEWVGVERIEGWSAAASNSVVERFVRVGTLLRRCEARLFDLRSPPDGASEAHALAHAVDTILSWLRDELVGWAESHRAVSRSTNAPLAAIVAAWTGLEMPEEVLLTLAQLLVCPFSRSPPYRPLPSASSSASLLTLVHAHLDASLASRAAPLIQSLLAWIVERTSEAWRSDVASWIGWPGATSLRSLMQVRVGEDDSSNQTRKGRGDARRVAPWSGAEVEWGHDDRGEEDVGYVLRPSRLPAFASVSVARELLEGGRALRLLRKAAPPDHPLLSPSARSTVLPVPGWEWDAATIEAHNEAVRQHVHAVRKSIALWRRRRGDDANSRAPSSDATTAWESSSAAASSLRAAAAASSGDQNGSTAFPSLTSSGWQHAEDLFNAPPNSRQEVVTANDKISETTPAALTPRQALVRFLARRLQTIPTTRTASAPQQRAGLHIAPPVVPSLLPANVPDLGALTRLSLQSPLQRWSTLVNSALISVFFRDLGLGIYLETCRHFLLLGHAQFLLRVREGLFGEGEGDDEGGSDADAPLKGIGLSRRLRTGGTWPPGSAELSTVLNPAVMETVADIRAAQERIEEQSARPDAKGKGSLIALKDLDERLSFAIVTPDRAKKGGVDRWRDPDSIDALDWLTLSFFPPPLIAPLLTQHASSMYQRLFNFLLRIMRVQSVLRGLSLDVTTRYKGRSGPRSSKGRDDDDHDRPLPFSDDDASHRLLLSFRHEAHHLVSALGSFVEDVAIRDTWSRFQSRLEKLRRDAEARDDRPFREAPVGVGLDDVAATGKEEDEDDGQAMTQVLELKDVFSLARYHESVLSRMLSACFLRQRQKGVRKIVDDLLQLILDLGRLVKGVRVGDNGGVSTAQDRQALANLHKRYQSRFGLLLRALAVVRERGGTSATTAGPTAALAAASAAAALSAASRTSMSRAEAGRLEMQKQEAEGEADLRTLMGDGAHQEGDVALVADLMGRLDLFGRWR